MLPPAVNVPGTSACVLVPENLTKLLPDWIWKGVLADRL